MAQVSVYITKYFSGEEIKNMNWASHAASIWEERSVYISLVGKMKEITFGRPGRR